MGNCNNPNQNCGGNNIYVSGSETRNAIDVSNNKARYYAELAESYKNEAKEMRDSAQYYAEQNSDVTMAYIDSLDATLRNLIDGKQNAGNYALSTDIPVKVSDLQNDTGFITAVPAATCATLGIVKPDGETLTVDNGILSTKISFRSIGEIISSTIPLTDSGLHPLDGTLLSGTGSYSDFVDYIAGLYNSGDYTAIFDTEANWQAAVTAYGVCGKFVYDSVNNTVRLPKITGFIEGASGAATLGDLTEAGLPNITGSTMGEYFGGSYTSSDVSGAIGRNSSGSFKYGSNTSGTGYTCGFDFDASRSSAIYGNSSTVQPQSVKVLYYIVVATVTKTNIEVDIDEIATDLNGKADVDLNNMNASQSAKNTIVSWGLPDYANGITVAASDANEQTYTAPSAGFFNFSLWSQGSTYAYVKVNDVYAIYGDNYSNQSTAYINITGSILVNKNDVIKFKTSKSLSAWGNYNYFYPAKGVN